MASMAVGHSNGDAASRPSMKPIVCPTPPPKSSYTTGVGSLLRPGRASAPLWKCSRVNGETRSHRAPISAGTVLLSVTRPMTVPRRMIRKNSLLFVHYPDNHPSHGTLLVTDCFASRHSIRRNNHSLVHTCAMGVNRCLRHALGFAFLVDGLAQQQSPALQARMLPSGDQISFDAG